MPSKAFLTYLILSSLYFQRTTSWFIHTLLFYFSKPLLWTIQHLSQGVVCRSWKWVEEASIRSSLKRDLYNHWPITRLWPRNDGNRWLQTTTDVTKCWNQWHTYRLALFHWACFLRTLVDYACYLRLGLAFITWCLSYRIVQVFINNKYRNYFPF